MCEGQSKQGVEEGGEEWQEGRDEMWQNVDWLLLHCVCMLLLLLLRRSQEQGQWPTLSHSSSELASTDEASPSEDDDEVAVSARCGRVRRYRSAIATAA